MAQAPDRSNCGIARFRGNLRSGKAEPEPPDADPHVRWCGRREGKRDPIGPHRAHQSLKFMGDGHSARGSRTDPRNDFMRWVPSRHDPLGSFGI